ncbi:hypothetical protein IFM47457_09518 [Aspergillus lentulus]|nr:hypothetical protein IFM47457_09518 [Aspergillus lentulus]
MCGKHGSHPGYFAQETPAPFLGQPGHWQTLSLGSDPFESRPFALVVLGPGVAGIAHICAIILGDPMWALPLSGATSAGQTLSSRLLA